MMQAQQAAHMKKFPKIGDDDSENLMFDKVIADDDELDNKEKPKADGQMKGLLEWLASKRSSNFMVDVDRQFIRNKENLVGLKEELRD